MLERGDQLFTSAFAVGEILVKPMETGRREIAERYLAFFRHPAVAVIPFELETSSRYAAIRGDRSVRPADAIHLACAACAGIDLFITNDDRLSRKVVSGISFLCALDHAPL
jgi:predicted nucleic acid-binding protein